MLYPYKTLNDDTEIVHSEIIKISGKETVKVYIEKPVYGGFHSVIFWLPEYKCENVQGYSEKEVAHLKRLIKNNEHHIMELAQKYTV